MSGSPATWDTWNYLNSRGSYVYFDDLYVEKGNSLSVSFTSYVTVDSIGMDVLINYGFGFGNVDIDF